MLKRLVFVALFATSLPFVAEAAEQRFYVCKMNVKERLGWVSQEMGFVFNGRGGVQVIDAATLTFMDGPAKATMSGRGGKWRIGWTVPNITDSKGQYLPSMRYLANLDENKLTVNVTARPYGVPQNFRGKGSCKRRKPKKP